MQQERPSTTLELLRRSLSDPVLKKAFIDLQRERWRWICSYRQAQAHIDHWLDTVHANRFPIESAGDAVRVIGDAAFLDPVLAVEAKVLRLRNREMRKVEPRDRRERGTG